MLDPNDARQWHNNKDIMENTRDVIFDWARGITRCTGQYPPNHTYSTLVEYEVSVRGRNVVLDEDEAGEDKAGLRPSAGLDGHHGGVGVPEPVHEAAGVEGQAHPQAQLRGRG